MTGAGGFIGGHLVRRLQRDGHTVYGFGRRSRTLLPNLEGVTYRPWDLTTGRLPDAPAVDAVVHCAANVADWGQYRSLYDANVAGTRAVLDTFYQVRRFVHLSSASVYDPRTPKVLVKESAPLPARYFNAYARTKMLAEQLLAASRRPVIILRPHIVYGPNDTTILPRLLQARRFGRLILAGNGTNHLSLTHVDNLVDAIGHAISGPCDRGTFNIADDVAPTVDAAVRAALLALNLEPSIHYLPARLAWPLAIACEGAYAAARVAAPPPITRYLLSQLTTEYTLDTSSARTELGYHPTIDYRSGFASIGPLTGVDHAQ